LTQLSNLPRESRSTQVLVRFLLRTIILAAFAAFSAVSFHRSLAVLLWLSIIFSAVVGTLKREQPFDVVLNHWDEAAAYAALVSLVSIFNPAVAA
jgi:hypothetical protein